MLLPQSSNAGEDVLLAAWGETLARKRDAPAIFNTDGKVIRTFREIEEAAQAFQAKFPAAQPYNVNAIQIGNHPDWPSLLLACLRANRVVLPIDESVTKQQSEAAVAVATKSAVTDWANQPPTLFKLTSGTTAEPRIIRFRSEQLLADCNQICLTMGITDSDLNFGVIPVSHSYGFSNLLTPLVARGVPMVLSCDRLPRAVLTDLVKTNATVFPGMPLFYQAFCEMNELPDLPKLRLCISAGAPLSGAIARRFVEKFARPIHSFYGSSECGGICYDPDGTIFEDGYVGTAMNGVQVTVLDRTAESSQIEVRSAAVGDGYFPKPDEEKLGHGFFCPDDLLTSHGKGLRIAGRVSDVINVAGKKVNPAQVEQQLRQRRGVREVVVFGRKSSQRNEEVAACVVAEQGVTEAELLEFCRERLSSWQAPKRIFILDELPVNERGKVSRRELAARFAEE